ncbi:hypothetical protein SK128_024457, partial [Halocaridina rubra]
MADVKALTCQLTQARNELNNLRKKMQALQAQHQKDVLNMKSLLTNRPQSNSTPEADCNLRCQSELFCNWKPIGYLKTCFQCKNGTPRQGSVANFSRGSLQVEKHTFNNPQHSLEGLQEYSHVWIFFVFDKNGDGIKGNHSKSKIAPPRLNGDKIGVFASRSPHRPNPLGLTLARLDKIEGDSLYLSGLDILNDTPVIDIKPYIPAYDSPTSKAVILRPDSPLGFDSSTINQTSSHSSTAHLEEMNIEGRLFCPRMHVSSQQLSCNVDYTIIREQSNILFQEKIVPNECFIPEDSEMGSSKNANITTYKELIDSSSMQSSDCTLRMLPVVSLPSLPTEVKTAAWLEFPPSSPLEVIFNPVAEKQIKRFYSNALESSF